ncbi:MAG: Fic family protein [Peptococcaceae bacterium]|jgi:Fic family protein|nr:Fic family protein [Peptococcaceae bacterium]
MDAALFAQMLSDKSVIDLKKLSYKYPGVDLDEFIGLLRANIYKPLPLLDFAGNGVVYMAGPASVRQSAVRLLAASRGGGNFGLRAMEDEITATLTLENIDFTRDSVRKILRGYAPADESENRVLGLKQGLDFIAQPANTITEASVQALYEIAIGKYLPAGDRLMPGAPYRHDKVYIVGQELEHVGLPHEKLPAYMGLLVDFINGESQIDDLLKATAIHFYIAYLHPWFDGNGRLARLLHIWYLRRRGWPSAMFIPFSSFIERSRQAYYNAFTLCEKNAARGGVLDVTPFLVYFIANVYNKLEDTPPRPDTLTSFGQLLAAGKITEKEKELWGFVLSAYGGGEFSTKQLERDFGRAAYATIRGFARKFEEFGLLISQKYGNRVKYAVKAR